MENKSNNSNNLLKAILLACIATAALFILGNRYFYDTDKSPENDVIAATDNVEVAATPDVANSDIYSEVTSPATTNAIETQNTIDEEQNSVYLTNSLETGATPYSKYYGRNKKCTSYGCSQIKVHTSNSDVLVTIKKDGTVVRHAYIKGGDSFTFSFPNGTYQAFFYYGRGWNPDKEMKGGEIKGGFVADESFGKDDPQTLSNNILEYSLILQQNGNFSTRPSDSDEAL